MPRNSNKDNKRMFEIIENSIKFILNHMKIDTSTSDMLARDILRKNSRRIEKLLDMPYGGTLAPEEIAQVLVSEYRNIVS